MNRSLFDSTDATREKNNSSYQYSGSVLTPNRGSDNPLARSTLIHQSDRDKKLLNSVATGRSK